MTKDEYIQGLHTEKQALNRELALYKASNAKVKAKAGPDAGFVPVNTRLTTDLAVDDNGAATSSFFLIVCLPSGSLRLDPSSSPLPSFAVVW